MRFFLIPISTKRALIYSRPLNKDLSKELSLADKASSKAAKTWAKWEELDKGWRKHVVSWGNKVQQRIPYEEWGLKSIPSLNAQQRLDESHGTKKIDVLFPGNAIKSEKLLPVLRTIATERQDFHRKKMWGSIAAAPITAPIGLIPVYAMIFLKKVSIADDSLGYQTFLSSILCTGPGRIGEVSGCSSFSFARAS